MEPKFKQKEPYSSKKTFWWIQVEDGQKGFQVQMYNQLLDILVFQLGERFKAFDAIKKKLNISSRTELYNAQRIETNKIRI